MVQRLSLLLCAAVVAVLLWWVWPRASVGSADSTAPAAPTGQSEYGRAADGSATAATPSLDIESVERQVPGSSAQEVARQSGSSGPAPQSGAEASTTASRRSNPDCVALEEAGGYRSVRPLAGTPAFSQQIKDLMFCARRQQLGTPSVEDLEFWMIHAGDDPGLLELIGRQWQFHQRPETARSLILSIPEQQRSVEGWITLAQTLTADVDINKPLNASGRTSIREALSAWERVLESDPELPSFLQFEIAEKYAYLGQHDAAVYLTEKALGEVLQNPNRARWVSDDGLAMADANALFNAAEVYMALDQPQLAAAYMDQAEVLVADNPA